MKYYSKPTLDFYEKMSLENVSDISDDELSSRLEATIKERRQLEVDYQDKNSKLNNRKLIYEKVLAIRYWEDIERNFKLNDKHLKLLQDMNFMGIWYGDVVSIGADGKRPFGNSDYYSDVAKILGIKNYDSENDKHTKKIERILDELPLALNTIIKNYKI